MEERIGYRIQRDISQHPKSLNPYCNGRKNRIISNQMLAKIYASLNPYCNGRKNRIETFSRKEVADICSLNPYCSGRKNRI